MSNVLFQRLKLTITPLKLVSKKYQKDSENPEFTVMFNPNTYSIEKAVAYDRPRDGDGRKMTDRTVNAPTLTFGGGGGRSVRMELFFDTTEVKEPPANAAAKSKALEEDDENIPPMDVRQSNLQRLVALSEIFPNLGRPAPVWLSWGGRDLVTGGKDMAFVGVLTSLTQTFTLFAGDGRPLRATVPVRFDELLDREADQRKTDPEFTTRVVRRGDSLAAIAAEQYGDPAAWRKVADANGLDDPRQLPVGSALALPKT